MAQREQVKKQPRPVAETTVEESTPVSDRGQALKEEMDELLDEIDGVLEENAADFVKSYVQKGGQ